MPFSKRQEGIVSGRNDVRRQVRGQKPLRARAFRSRYDDLRNGGNGMPQPYELPDLGLPEVGMAGVGPALPNMRTRTGYPESVGIGGGAKFDTLPALPGLGAPPPPTTVSGRGRATGRGLRRRPRT